MHTDKNSENPTGLPHAASATQGDWWPLVPGWLGREPLPSDGLPAAHVDDAVARLAAQGFVVPPLLRELHVRLGACVPLMRGFQRFEPPADWAVDEGLLLFLDEAQGVCQWVVDAQGQVSMWLNDALHPEPLQLAQFLGVILPYQLAQGGWPHAANTVVPARDLEAERQRVLAALGWPLLANHNGLTIHGQGARMLWSLDALPGQDQVHLFMSCLHQADLDALCARFGFVDLG